LFRIKVHGLALSPSASALELTPVAELQSEWNTTPVSPTGGGGGPELVVVSVTVVGTLAEISVWPAAVPELETLGTSGSSETQGTSVVSCGYPSEFSAVTVRVAVWPTVKFDSMVGAATVVLSTVAETTSVSAVPPTLVTWVSG
jgi:hypothetical protein